MSLRVDPGKSPAPTVVVPFFVAAPAALMLAGLGIANSSSETFVAINARHNVAITHAIVLGWLSLTMMGALYQLGPAVLESPMRSSRLARIQLVIHACGIVVFVTGLWRWQLGWMSVGGSLVVISAVLFVANTMRRSSPSSPLTVLYVRAAQLALLATVALGITFVGNHQHGWFAITPGRLAVHAHAGLAGWIGLTLMGVSYQLVPMFNVVHGTRPRFARVVLWLAIAGIGVFAGMMASDPPRPLRLLAAAPLALAFGLWLLDQSLLLRARARRRLDIHGRATMVSLCFLGLTLMLAAGAAWGAPFSTAGTPARWPLAYGAAATLGWAGMSIIGNGHKILPFLVWFHRYQHRMGLEDVPLMRDLYSERLATAILATHGAATLGVAGGALLGNLMVFRGSGILLIGSGGLQVLSYALILCRCRVRTPQHEAVTGVAQ